MRNFNDEKSEEVFGLPNIKSAKKRVLVSQTKAMQNKAAKSRPTSRSLRPRWRKATAARPMLLTRWL